MRRRCGLFGKLPACGDFIATGVPRDFLERWEAWLQEGLEASRTTLGTAWLQAYLVAPIWRFNIDVAIGGRQAVGALMPSIDSAGRCFPLTLVACSDIAGSVHADEAWFALAENYLLGALAPKARLSELLEKLGDLPWPAAPRRDDGPGTGESIWRTAGGSGSAGWCFRRSGLPPADTMAGLLKGRPFEDAGSFEGGDR